MDAREVTRVGTSVGLTFYAEIQVLIFDMRWLILLCVVLIFVDLKFGLENSQVHGIKWRRSRASRRTVNKFIDYMCWLMFAGVLGAAIGTPLGIDRIVIATVVMILACLNEVDSIIQNYCESRGIEDFSLRKLLISFARKKDKDLGDALDETLKDKKKNGNEDID